SVDTDDVRVRVVHAVVLVPPVMDGDHEHERIAEEGEERIRPTPWQRRTVRGSVGHRRYAEHPESRDHEGCAGEPPRPKLPPPGEAAEGQGQVIGPFQQNT